MRCIQGTFVLLCAATPLAAQSAGSGSLDLPALLPRGEEIALARSAAPPDVSGDATVLVLQRGGYVVAEAGSNGVTCYVSRTWPGSLEPHCFDEEGSRTILQMALRRAELREQRKSREEIDGDIADGLRTGRFRLPTRPAMSYMMSSRQVLYNDDGAYVGQWKPHLMIYVPYITSAALGLGPEPSLAAAVVVDDGLPTANIMIVVSEFAADPGSR
jgi:hypothetical protein